MLTWLAVAPALPRFIVSSAEAAALQTNSAYDGPVVIVVRFMGGNDGLNAVVPVNDDRYYKARPTIAIPKNQTNAGRGNRPESLANGLQKIDG